MASSVPEDLGWIAESLLQYEQLLPGLCPVRTHLPAALPTHRGELSNIYLIHSGKILLYNFNKKDSTTKHEGVKVAHSNIHSWTQLPLIR